ncbi:MAG: hypothetical protein AAF125_16770, partial [Chloroflexota bacterium]
LVKICIGLIVLYHVWGGAPSQSTGHRAPSSFRVRRVSQEPGFIQLARQANRHSSAIPIT